MCDCKCKPYVKYKAVCKRCSKGLLVDEKRYIDYDNDDNIIVICKDCHVERGGK